MYLVNILHILHITDSLLVRRVQVRQNTTVFVSVLLGWRHVSATVGHLQVTIMYNEEKLHSVRSLVVVHILNFQLPEHVPQLMILHCVVFPHYTFLWPEDGPEWPKHVIRLIKQIQRQLFWRTCPLLLCIKHNGVDASKVSLVVSALVCLTQAPVFQTLLCTQLHNERWQVYGYIYMGRVAQSV